MTKKEIELLLKVILELSHIVTILDKVKSGFDDNDVEKIALCTLLFLSEEEILDRLAEIVKLLYIKLSKLIGGEELYSIFEVLDSDLYPHDEEIKYNKHKYKHKYKIKYDKYKYKIKYNLTKEEIKEEILKNITLFKSIK